MLFSSFYVCYDILNTLITGTDEIRYDKIKKYKALKTKLLKIRKSYFAGHKTSQ